MGLQTHDVHYRDLSKYPVKMYHNSNKIWFMSDKYQRYTLSILQMCFLKCDLCQLIYVNIIIVIPNVSIGPGDEVFFFSQWESIAFGCLYHKWNNLVCFFEIQNKLYFASIYNVLN